MSLYFTDSQVSSMNLSGLANQLTSDQITELGNLLLSEQTATALGVTVTTDLIIAVMVDAQALYDLIFSNGPWIDDTVLTNWAAAIWGNDVSPLTPTQRLQIATSVLEAIGKLHVLSSST